MDELIGLRSAPIRVGAYRLVRMHERFCSISDRRGTFVGVLLFDNLIPYRINHWLTQHGKAGHFPQPFRWFYKERRSGNLQMFDSFDDAVAWLSAQTGGMRDELHR